MIKLSAGDPYSSYRRGPRRAILRVEMRIFRVEMQFLIELLSPNSEFRCIEHTLCATVKHNVYSPRVGIRISRIRYRGSGFASRFSALVSRFSALVSRFSALVSRNSISRSHDFTTSRFHAKPRAALRKTQNANKNRSRLPSPPVFCLQIIFSFFRRCPFCLRRRRSRRRRAPYSARGSALSDAASGSSARRR